MTNEEKKLVEEFHNALESATHPRHYNCAKTAEKVWEHLNSECKLRGLNVNKTDRAEILCAQIYKNILDANEVLEEA